MKRSLTLVLTGLLLAAAGHAQVLSEVGSGGHVYRLEVGTYAELFPGGLDASMRAQVMMLERRLPTGETERLLVPGTENFSSEIPASLVVDSSKSGEAVFVLWEGFHNETHPKVYLAWMDGSGWNDVIELGVSPFGRKSSPQLLLTKDSLRSDDPEPALSWTERTILHLTWLEEYGSADNAKLYAPIVLEDGQYTGDTPIFKLTTSVESASAAPGSDMGRMLTLRPGRNHRSVMAGFLDPETSQVILVDLEVVSPSLLELAEKARLQIIGYGFKATLQETANGIFERILGLSERFHTASLHWIAAGVREVVLETPPEDDITAVASKARLQIIGYGMSFKTQGLVGKETETAQNLFAPGLQPESVSHAIRSEVIFRRDAPDVEVTGPASLIFSETGDNVIVAWEKGDMLYFVRAEEDGGWSEPEAIPLDSEIDGSIARDMLSRRIRLR